MREIQASQITRTVARLTQEACYKLPEYVLDTFRKSREMEESPDGRDVFDQLLANAEYAVSQDMPLCQDCGMAIVFLELGQDVHIVGGDLYEAVNRGVGQGYTEGYMRKSVVEQPFTERLNTEDNTPAVIHTDIVPGDKLRIVFTPTGGGVMKSQLRMLYPAQGRQGIIDFAVETVENAGSYACPPYTVGVGIGGTPDSVVTLAKRALLRRTGEPSPNPDNAALERDILKAINNLGIGPMGYGGRMTVLAVHVESFPCHFGSLPVAVYLQCHNMRQKEAVL